MTQHADRLREAFQTHENETPDPAVVYARVEELARKHRWRRRGAQAAGGAVLSAGLIAGIANLPSVLPGGPQPAAPAVGFEAAAPATPTATPSSTPSASEQELLDRYGAYFRAGYSYNEAVELARLWQMTPKDIGAVKAEAGRRLLAGETLPVQPAADPTEDPDDEERSKQISAFFNTGYDYDDAVKLAKLWKLKDPYEAKAVAGQKLLDGKKLPIRPDPELAEEGRINQAIAAFFDAGYDYDDAVKLAKLWKLDSPGDAKALAGKKLLTGQKLPFKP